MKVRRVTIYPAGKCNSLNSSCYIEYYTMCGNCLHKCFKILVALVIGAAKSLQRLLRLHQA